MTYIVPYKDLIEGALVRARGALDKAQHNVQILRERLAKAEEEKDEATVTEMTGYLDDLNRYVTEVEKLIADLKKGLEQTDA